MAHADEEHVEGKEGIDQSDKPRAGSMCSSHFIPQVTISYRLHLLVAAEYLAKGYQLSDQILQRAIEIDSASLLPRPCTHFNSIGFLTRIDKQGISQRFLSYFHSFDTTVGARTLGADQTISGKVQQTVSAAAERAKGVDAEKGYSKTAGEVSQLMVPGQPTQDSVSTIPKRCPRLSGRRSRCSTPTHRSKYSISMKRHVVSLRTRRRPRHPLRNPLKLPQLLLHEC